VCGDEKVLTRAFYTADMKLSRTYTRSLPRIALHHRNTKHVRIGQEFSIDWASPDFVLPCEKSAEFSGQNTYAQTHACVLSM
jgi:hypothetical protein